MDLKVFKCCICGEQHTKLPSNNFFKCDFCGSINYFINEDEAFELHQAQSALKRYRFAKVDAIYEDLFENTKNIKTQAMCLWGRLLAYFGIVYIKSFDGNKYIPTFTRYLEDYSSLSDSSYFQELLNLNLDGNSLNEYKQKVKLLDEEYKKIKDNIKLTPKYDVFICVKISCKTEKNPDAEGYTRDCRIATSIYNELKKRGLKPFYSEIDIGGINYDSQIFTALSRSKKILVISTKKEYLESAWVESEWRRWINFIDAKVKDENSLLLYLPEFYNSRFELPRILEDKRIQYFTSDKLLDLLSLIENNQSKTVKTETKKSENETIINESEFKTFLSKANQLFIKKDYQEAFKIYKSLENTNDDEVNYMIGCCYFYEYGVEKSYDQAVYYFKKAVEKGNVNAQNHLGYCYFYGYGIEKSYDQAIYYFKKAAEKGNVNAQNHLGYCYFYGYGVEKSNVESFNWYKKSAEQGDPNGQDNLSLCYSKGEGVAQSYDQAVYWCQKAVEQNYAAAQNRMGSYYYNGRGVAQSYDQAFKLFKLAAEQNHAIGQYNLGLCYHYGDGVEKSEEKALYWYKKSLENGYEPANSQIQILLKK